MYLAENMEPFSNSADPDGPDDYCFWLRLCERPIKGLVDLELCVVINIFTP